MPAIHIILGEQLLQRVDAVARRRGMNRSAFVREVLYDALGKTGHTALERKHREGYARKPVTRGEFDL